MSIYKSFIRPILFLQDPDVVHEKTIKTGNLLGKSFLTRGFLKLFFNFENSALETEVFGIKFKNPIGIAGGFDKNANLIQTLPSVGFGFTEIGSITAKPYDGNKKPWNVRLKKEKALIINYGLKNEGVDFLKPRIKKQKRFVPLIINIAKTNDERIKGDGSVNDYNESFVKLQQLGDIINLNISCPNTGDGVLFCESPKLLDKLLKKIGEDKIKKPIVLKLKPDLSDALLDEILKIATKYSFIKGFIVSNLTSNRKLLKYIKEKDIERYNGGISGKPLFKLSNGMIKKVYKKTHGKYPIIGVGGVFSAKDAYEKICSGASLIELATGLIYEGPMVIKKINMGLLELLRKDGFENISQAVGSKV